MDPFPEPAFVIGEFPGVSQKDLWNYIVELRTLLNARYRDQDAFAETVRVVRSKHVLWEVRDKPGECPCLSELSDREVLRVVSMILRGMHKVLVNNQNRGKFYVSAQDVVG